MVQIIQHDYCVEYDCVEYQMLFSYWAALLSTIKYSIKNSDNLDAIEI